MFKKTFAKWNINIALKAHPKKRKISFNFYLKCVRHERCQVSYHRCILCRNCDYAECINRKITIYCFLCWESSCLSIDNYLLLILTVIDQPTDKYLHLSISHWAVTTSTWYWCHVCTMISCEEYSDEYHRRWWSSPIRFKSNAQETEKFQSKLRYHHEIHFSSRSRDPHRWVTLCSTHHHLHNHPKIIHLFNRP